MASPAKKATLPTSATHRNDPEQSRVLTLSKDPATAQNSPIDEDHLMVPLPVPSIPQHTSNHANRTQSPTSASLPPHHDTHLHSPMLTPTTASPYSHVKSASPFFASSSFSHGVLRVPSMHSLANTSSPSFTTRSPSFVTRSPRPHTRSHMAHNPPPLLLSPATTTFSLTEPPISDDEDAQLPPERDTPSASLAADPSLSSFSRMLAVPHSDCSEVVAIHTHDVDDSSLDIPGTPGDLILDPNHPNFDAAAFDPYPDDLRADADATGPPPVRTVAALLTYEYSDPGYDGTLCCARDGCCARVLPGSVRAEAYALLRLALPLMAGFVSQNFVNIVNMGFLGHLDSDSLAAAALGIMYCNVFGVSLVMGMCAAIDTLGAQAYGAGNFKRVGLIVQRVTILALLMLLPLACAWWWSAHVLEQMFISPNIAALSQQYIRHCLPGLVGVTFMDIMRRYMEAQGNTRPAMVANLVGLALVAPLDHLFINVLDMGYLGAAHVYVVSAWVTALTVLSYNLFTGFHKKTWPPLSLRVFQGWGEILGVSVFAILMLVSEWWAFEIHTFIAAKGGDSAVGAQALLTNLNAFLFMIPMSFGIAASARVGAFLGANKPVAARHSMRTVLMLSLCGQLLISTLMFFLNAQIGRAFTSDEEVLRLMRSVLPLLCLLCVFDGLQGTFAGVFRGAGLQRIASAANVVGYWVLALPLAVYLAFYVGAHDRPVEDSSDIDPLTLAATVTALAPSMATHGLVLRSAPIGIVSERTSAYAVAPVTFHPHVEHTMQRALPHIRDDPDTDPEPEPWPDPEPSPAPVYERVRGLGILGQWLAMIGASVVVCTTFAVVALRLDWSAKALNVHLRELHERAGEAALNMHSQAVGGAGADTDSTVAVSGAEAEGTERAYEAALERGAAPHATAPTPRARLLVSGEDSAGQYGSYR